MQMNVIVRYNWRFYASYMLRLMQCQSHIVSMYFRINTGYQISKKCIRKTNSNSQYHSKASESQFQYSSESLAHIWRWGECSKSIVGWEDASFPPLWSHSLQHLNISHILLSITLSAFQAPLCESWQCSGLCKRTSFTGHASMFWRVQLETYPLDISSTVLHC